MEIDEIFDTFCLRVAEIELYRSVARDTTRPVVRRLDEIAQAEADRTGDVSLPFSVQSMGFRDPESGEYVRYGAAVSRTEDRAQQVVRQQDRQYGWLLVEAYEEFEDFLERTYAWLGRHDWQAWRLGEFGNIWHAELSEQPFRWYLETVRHKFAQNPRKILDRLRNLYPGLAGSRSAQQTGQEPASIRRVDRQPASKIVHARGRISDRNDFVKDVITQCGLWNNGRPKAKHREAVEKYLSPDADDWVVTLIEVSVPPPDGAPPGFWRALSPHSDICGKLISDLVADAALVHRCVSSHPAATPAA